MTTTEATAPTHTECVFPESHKVAKHKLGTKAAAACIDQALVTDNLHLLSPDVVEWAKANIGGFAEDVSPSDPEPPVTKPVRVKPLRLDVGFTERKVINSVVTGMDKRTIRAAGISREQVDSLRSLSGAIRHSSELELAPGDALAFRNVLRAKVAGGRVTSEVHRFLKLVESQTERFDRIPG